jgi:hypothetical protein
VTARRRPFAAEGGAPGGVGHAFRGAKTPRIHCRVECAPIVCFQRDRAISIRIHCRVDAAQQRRRFCPGGLPSRSHFSIFACRRAGSEPGTLCACRLAFAMQANRLAEDSDLVQLYEIAIYIVARYSENAPRLRRRVSANAGESSMGRPERRSSLRELVRGQWWRCARCGVEVSRPRRATGPGNAVAKVADQEHTCCNNVVRPRRAFAIVLPVLAFLRTGSAPQRRRDPALRRRGCCGGVCADGPRRRLRSGLPPLPRRF